LAFERDRDAGPPTAHGPGVGLAPLMLLASCRRGWSGRLSLFHLSQREPPPTWRMAKHSAGASDGRPFYVAKVTAGRQVAGGRKRSPRSRTWPLAAPLLR
jgi:hypothetical protein